MRQTLFSGITVFLLFSSFSAAPAFAADQLNDVSYGFDSAKFAAAENAFHFLRSYVDYYYLLYAGNKKQFTAISDLASQSGWCVGDAHPENFGTQLTYKGKSIFTMNDMDDSGPCPIVLDLFRLMVSSHLYDANISLESIVSNYLDGLNGKNHKYSDAVTNMLDKSKSRGIEMDPSELENGRFKRDASTQEVGPAISGQISQILTGLGSVLASHASIQDVYQTAKVGGGSGGMARYEVLINDGGKLLYIELKEETTPSIYPVATEPIPPVQQRIFNTLNADQSGRESAFYGVVFVNNKNMLMRPKFPGEIGVNLAKQSKSENKNIIDDEAYILGSIHAATVSHDKKYAADVANIKKSDWKHDVDLMADFFSSKYKSLKSQ